MRSSSFSARSREYKVTYREDFPPPAKGSVSFKRRPDRYGMVCAASVNEAAFAYDGGLKKEGGFDLTLGGAAKLQTHDDTVAQYRTNMQVSSKLCPQPGTGH